jgi:hypothetical protein
MKMRLRVIRIIEYEGEPEWLKKTLDNSIQGTKEINGNFIRTATLGNFPEIITNNLNKETK